MHMHVSTPDIDRQALQDSRADALEQTSTTALANVSNSATVT